MTDNMFKTNLEIVFAIALSLVVPIIGVLGGPVVLFAGERRIGAAMFVAGVIGVLGWLAILGYY